MSALERNPQVLAPTPHKVLGPGIDGRGIPRGPRAQKQGTGFGHVTKLGHVPEGPTGLSHVPPWCESILGFKVEAVQGKLVSLEWTGTSGGLWEWWHHPGVPIAFPVESASS